MSITLKYWNGRGLMEVPRIMLAIAGKFPGDYQDLRIGDKADVEAQGGDTKNVVAFADIGDLSANLGRVPLCETPAGSIGQSAAINYYIASDCGLLGSSLLEAAQILSIQEHIKELMTVWSGLVPWGVEPSAEALDLFFDSDEAKDYSGPAVRDTMKARRLKWFMGRMEAVVGDNGFAVGDKISYADVLLFNAFANKLNEDETLGEIPAYRREPFASSERTNAALAAHPKIKKIVDNVAANANVQKWLSIRGKQGF